MGEEESQNTTHEPKALYFVIFRRTGVGIFSRTLSRDKNGREIQETLFSGLLSGIMTFADEMIGGQISSFKIEEKYVILEGSDTDIVFCLVATRDDPNVRQLLFDIEARFQLRFGELSQLGFEFEEQALESFGLELDRMVESWEKEISKSIMVRGLSFSLFKIHECQNLPCEIALAFSFAWNRRKTVKSGLFKKKPESLKRFVRLFFPCYLVPIEGLGFAIASPFFSDQSDLRKVDLSSLKKLHKDIQERKNTISLLKEAVFQVVLPKDNLGAKTADFSFRADFKTGLGALMLIPSWNTVQLPVRDEGRFIQEISNVLTSAFQIHAEARTLVENTWTKINNRFQGFEKELKQEIIQLEEKFRKEREEISLEIDAKVAKLLKKHKDKRAEYTRKQRESESHISNSYLTSLDWETDQKIEVEENRLIKHDQKRSNALEALEMQIEDVRRLFRNLKAWCEQANKMTIELDKNLETSLIPPKHLMDIFQANVADEILDDRIEGAIRIFFPFYAITYVSNGEKREEIIGPGKISIEGNRHKFIPWNAMSQAASSAWDQVSRDIKLVRNLDNINLLKNPETRSLILDGLRKLRKKTKIMEEKVYKGLVEGCRVAFDFAD
ncbi:MAG: hypothetical protein ACE5OZ_09045 [Candidatus Heimdallarchaeota archaeon]